MTMAHGDEEGGGGVGGEAGNFPLHHVMRSGETGKPPRSPPPSAEIREESLRKQLATHRLLKHVMHEEAKVRIKEACLERLLVEKAKVEKRLQVSTSMLPGSDDVATMKARLEAARQRKRRAANKVTELGEFFLMANKTAKKRNYGASREHRHYIELKQSIRSLNAEIVSLRRRVQRICENKNGNGDTPYVPPRLPDHERISMECSRLDRIIENLKDKQIEYEERLRAASDALSKATKYEAKVTQTLEYLERQSMKMSHRLTPREKSTQPDKTPQFGVGNKVDLFPFPPDSGTAIAVSVSRQSETGTPQKEKEKKQT